MATTIAGLASSAGVGVETVRYYQRRGLLATPARPRGAGAAGGIRRHGEEDARRPRFIRAAQAAGFTLDQIGELLLLDANEDGVWPRSTAPSLNWKNARCAAATGVCLCDGRGRAVPDPDLVRAARGMSAGQSAGSMPWRTQARPSSSVAVIRA